MKKTYIDTKPMDFGLGEELMNLTPKARKVKAKKKWRGLYQSKKLLHSTINLQQNRKETSQMGEDIYKQHVQQRVNIQNT